MPRRSRLATSPNGLVPRTSATAPRADRPTGIFSALVDQTMASQAWLMSSPSRLEQTHPGLAAFVRDGHDPFTVALSVADKIAQQMGVADDRDALVNHYDELAWATSASGDVADRAQYDELFRKARAIASVALARDATNIRAVDEAIYEALHALAADDGAVRALLTAGPPTPAGKGT